MFPLVHTEQHITLLFSFLTLLLTFGCLNRVQVGPVSFPTNQAQAKPASGMSFFDLSATDINGQLVKMDQYKAKKIMVVNTASECGYTPQYAQLQELYNTYKDKGFVMIGFPSNDFGSQEPAPRRISHSSARRTTVLLSL